MEIIKNGRNYKKQPKGGKKKCCRCKCKFKYESLDLYEAKSVVGTLNYYVNCPQCGNSIYIRPL